MRNETWRPVAGYEEQYEVSSLGRVKALERLVRSPSGEMRKLSETMIQTKTRHNGIPFVTLSRNGGKKDFNVGSL